MKRVLFSGVFCLTFIFLTSIAFAQDIIILKNGDEIKSKVIEVTPDLVKYNKWDNQEGPVYSSNKSDVFMIKYANGSKDVFSTTPVTNSNSAQISNVNKNIAVTDLDGNIYKTVTIGTQIWMAENLKTTKYNDNTTIPLVTNNSSWAILSTPGYCWYNNDETTFKGTYGALYNWYTVNTGKLCPTGWHVPTDSAWITLTTYLGGGSVAGGKLKETGTTHWLSPNTGATNETGFTALPGGNRYDSGTCNNIGNVGLWWSSTEYSLYTSNAWFRLMSYPDTFVVRDYYGKQFGFSVRCLRDN